MDRNSPIGVFDSGLGGLTVVRAIQNLLPQESLIFIADQAHVPYGNRPLEQVRGYAEAISEALFDAGCKAVVMACNISSAVAQTNVTHTHAPKPVIGMIKPGSHHAMECSKYKKIGIMATQGTVNSNAYPQFLKALCPAAEIHQVACPAFVPLVESGQTDGEAAFNAAQEYLKPLLLAGVDTIVLGCTHYPFLLPILQSLTPNIEYVDPAIVATEQLKQELGENDLLSTNTAIPPHYFATTGSVYELEKSLTKIITTSTVSLKVAQACWNDGVLTI